VTGRTESFGQGNGDVLLLNYDARGNLVWARTWGGSGDEAGYGVAVDQAGGIYVAGRTSSFGSGWFDALLLKFDSSGTLLWARTWGGGSYDVAYDIAFDQSGNVYLAAESYSLGPAAVLLKYSPGGDLLLTRTWDGPATYDSAYSVDVDAAGNVVLAGISWDYSFSPNHNTILLLKYDATGSLLWSRSWNAPWPGQAEAWGSKALRTDPSGNIYVAAKWSQSCSDFNFGRCDFDALVLKLDPDGNQLWAQTWGGAGYDVAASVSMDRAGNLFVAGNQSSVTSGSSSALLLGLDQSGSVLFGKNWVVNGNSSGASALADSNGGLLMAGSAPSTNGAWSRATNSAGPATGSIVPVTGFVGSASAAIGTPLGTVGVPSGIIDSGGGAADALLLHTASTSKSGSSGFLGFPLKGDSACTAAISSVMDHLGTPLDPNAGPSAGWFSKTKTDVGAYTGEVGTLLFGRNCDPPGFENANHIPFRVNGHYVGARCKGDERAPSLFLNYRGHPGYDYPVNSNTEILAPADGILRKAIRDTIDTCSMKISVSSWDAYHTFYIEHADGYSTWFLHASGLVPPVSVEIEQKGYAIVKKGQVVAYTGRFCGCVSEPCLNLPAHLHFEVRKNTPGDLDPSRGRIVDPYSDGLWDAGCETGACCP